MSRSALSPLSGDASSAGGDEPTPSPLDSSAQSTIAAAVPTLEPTLTYPGDASPIVSPVAAGTSVFVSGQVSESEGQYVTSSSKSSRYYYARDDNGWHRIHSANRVWFLTAPDLLRVYPGRTLHVATAPRATPTPTPAS